MGKDKAKGKQRQPRGPRSSKNGPSANLWRAHVLSTISTDTRPTLIIEFQTAKYVFGAPESTSRAIAQSPRNVRDVKSIFLSGIDAEKTAGLSSLIMNVADIGGRELSVVGPPGTSHLVATARSYARRQGITVKTTDFPAAVVPQNPSVVFTVPPTYSDDIVNVWAVKLDPDVSDVAMDESDSVSAMKRKREPSPDSPSKRVNVDGTPHPPSGSRYASVRTDTMEGDEAHRWRQTMIASTFTGAAGPAVVDRSLQRPRQTEGWGLPLPKFQWDESSFSRKSTLAYVLAGSWIRGKFDAQAAAALGVPNGVRVDLTLGKTVSFQVKDEGGNMITREVKPEQVVGESECPSVVVVLDVPTPAHIPSLLAQFCGGGESRPFLAQFRLQEAKERANWRVHSVYHTCGKDVLEDPRYQEFMRGFHEETSHHVTSPEYATDPVTFTTSAYNTLRLSKLDSLMFPVPHYSLISEKRLDSIPGLPPKTSLMRAGDVFGVRPATGLFSMSESADKFHPVVDNLELSEGTEGRFAEAKKEVEEIASTRTSSPSPGDDVVVVTTGTGSACATVSRSVLGNFIEIPNHGNILLDAGEGTYGQLARHYGSRIDELMRNLRLISVSHLHADHHLGLPGLLAARRRLDPPPTEPLYLLSTRPIMRYLSEVDDVQELGLSDESARGVIPLLNEVFLPAREYHQFAARAGGPSWRETWLQKAGSEEAVLGMYKSLGLENIQTVKVNHTSICYGINIKHTDGWSIVFSGDTTPTQSLVEAGRNATLLIHEASMTEEQTEMAAAKKHSTVPQALDIAVKMEAKNVLLTHFSTRYPRIVQHDRENEHEDGPSVTWAFDLARYRIGDMWKSKSYMKAIGHSYEETATEEDAEEEAAVLNRADGT